MQGWGILGVAFLYLLMLFAVASIGDRRAARWSSAPRPYIYALSLAVYSDCQHNADWNSWASISGLFWFSRLAIACYAIS